MQLKLSAEHGGAIPIRPLPASPATSHDALPRPVLVPDPLGPVRAGAVLLTRAEYLILRATGPKTTVPEGASSPELLLQGASSGHRSALLCPLLLPPPEAALPAAGFSH